MSVNRSSASRSVQTSAENILNSTDEETNPKRRSDWYKHLNYTTASRKNTFYEKTNILDDGESLMYKSIYADLLNSKSVANINYDNIKKSSVPNPTDLDVQSDIIIGNIDFNKKKQLFRRSNKRTSAYEKVLDESDTGTSNTSRLTVPLLRNKLPEDNFVEPRFNKRKDLFGGKRKSTKKREYSNAFDETNEKSKKIEDSPQHKKRRGLFSRKTSEKRDFSDAFDDTSETSQKPASTNTKEKNTENVSLNKSQDEQSSAGSLHSFTNSILSSTRINQKLTSPSRLKRASLYQLALSPSRQTRRQSRLSEISKPIVEEPKLLSPSVVLLSNNSPEEKSQNDENRQNLDSDINTSVINEETLDNAHQKVSSRRDKLISAEGVELSKLRHLETENIELKGTKERSRRNDIGTTSQEEDGVTLRKPEEERTKYIKKVTRSSTSKELNLTGEELENIDPQNSRKSVKSLKNITQSETTDNNLSAAEIEKSRSRSTQSKLSQSQNKNQGLGLENEQLNFIDENADNNTRKFRNVAQLSLGSISRRIYENVEGDKSNSGSTEILPSSKIIVKDISKIKEKYNVMKQISDGENEQSFKRGNVTNKNTSRKSRMEVDFPEDPDEENCSSRNSRQTTSYKRSKNSRNDRNSKTVDTDDADDEGEEIEENLPNKQILRMSRQTSTTNRKSKFNEDHGIQEDTGNNIDHEETYRKNKQKRGSQNTIINMSDIDEEYNEKQEMSRKMSRSQHLSSRNSRITEDRDLQQDVEDEDKPETRSKHMSRTLHQRSRNSRITDNDVLQEDTDNHENQVTLRKSRKISRSQHLSSRNSRITEDPDPQPENIEDENNPETRISRHMLRSLHQSSRSNTITDNSDIPQEDTDDQESQETSRKSRKMSRSQHLSSRNSRIIEDSDVQQEDVEDEENPETRKSRHISRNLHQGSRLDRITANRDVFQEDTHDQESWETSRKSRNMSRSQRQSSRSSRIIEDLDVQQEDVDEENPETFRKSSLVSRSQHQLSRHSRITENLDILEESIEDLENPEGLRQSNHMSRSQHQRSRNSRITNNPDVLQENTYHQESQATSRMSRKMLRSQHRSSRVSNDLETQQEDIEYQENLETLRKSRNLSKSQHPSSRMTENLDILQENTGDQEFRATSRNSRKMSRSEHPSSRNSRMTENLDILEEDTDNQERFINSRKLSRSQLQSSRNRMTENLDVLHKDTDEQENQETSKNSRIMARSQHQSSRNRMTVNLDVLQNDTDEQENQETSRKSRNMSRSQHENRNNRVTENSDILDGDTDEQESQVTSRNSRKMFKSHLQTSRNSRMKENPDILEEDTDNQKNQETYRKHNRSSRKRKVTDTLNDEHDNQQEKEEVTSRNSRQISLRKSSNIPQNVRNQQSSLLDFSHTSKVFNITNAENEQPTKRKELFRHSKSFDKIRNYSDALNDTNEVSTNKNDDVIISNNISLKVKKSTSKNETIMTNIEQQSPQIKKRKELFETSNKDRNYSDAFEETSEEVTEVLSSKKNKSSKQDTFTKSMEQEKHNTSAASGNIEPGSPQIRKRKGLFERSGYKERNYSDAFNDTNETSQKDVTENMSRRSTRNKEPLQNISRRSTRNKNISIRTNKDVPIIETENEINISQRFTRRGTTNNENSTRKEVIQNISQRLTPNRSQTTSFIHPNVYIRKTKRSTLKEKITDNNQEDKSKATNENKNNEEHMMETSDKQVTRGSIRQSQDIMNNEEQFLIELNLSRNIHSVNFSRTRSTSRSPKKNMTEANTRITRSISKSPNIRGTRSSAKASNKNMTELNIQSTPNTSKSLSKNITSNIRSTRSISKTSNKNMNIENVRRTRSISKLPSKNMTTSNIRSTRSISKSPNKNITFDSHMSTRSKKITLNENLKKTLFRNKSESYSNRKSKTPDSKLGDDDLESIQNKSDCDKSAKRKSKKSLTSAKELSDKLEKSIDDLNHVNNQTIQSGYTNNQNLSINNYTGNRQSFFEDEDENIINEEDIIQNGSMGVSSHTSLQNQFSRKESDNTTSKVALTRAKKSTVNEENKTSKVSIVIETSSDEEEKIVKTSFRKTSSQASFQKKLTSRTSNVSVAIETSSDEEELIRQTSFRHPLSYVRQKRSTERQGNKTSNISLAMESSPQEEEIIRKTSFGNLSPRSSLQKTVTTDVNMTSKVPIPIETLDEEEKNNRTLVKKSSSQSGVKSMSIDKSIRHPERQKSIKTRLSTNSTLKTMSVESDNNISHVSNTNKNSSLTQDRPMAVDESQPYERNIIDQDDVFESSSNTISKIDSRFIEKSKAELEKEKLEKNKKLMMIAKMAEKDSHKSKFNLGQLCKDLRKNNLVPEDIQKPSALKLQKLDKFFKKVNMLNFTVPKKKPEPKKKPDVLCFSNGERLKKPKLHKSEKWMTTRFYNYLEKQLEPKYGIQNVLEAEKLMILLGETFRKVKKAKKYLLKEVEYLQYRLAKAGLIVHSWDFMRFAQEYLPYEFRTRVLPTYVAKSGAQPGRIIVPYVHEERYTPIIELWESRNPNHIENV